MNKVDIEVRSNKVARALQASPAIVEKHLDRAFERGAIEIGRQAGQRVKKAFTTLWASIRHLQVAKLHWRVTTGTDYARAVEEGTKPGYLPNPVHLMGWIKLRGGIQFGATKPGTEKRQSQYDELRDRAWGLARSIQKRGTRAHPFMGPAARAMTPRVHELAEKAADAGLAESFGT